MLSTRTTQRLFAFILIFSSAVHALTLPKPSGPFDVYYNTAKMVDKTRADPFDPQKGNRAVMTSVFYPTHCQVNLEAINYLPPKTAALASQQFAAYGLPDGTLQSIQLQVCPESSRSRRVRVEPPVVIFSPAMGTPRHFYGLIAQAVSSFGYIVVSIDHPYDADIVEFPDGSIITAANLTDEQVPLDIDTRAQDVTFVLNQLSSASGVKELIPGSCGLKTQKAAIFGHSLGGAAAAQAMLNDKRIVGGVNLDGTFFSTVVQEGLRRPFLIFGHENKNQSTDSSWAEMWSNLHGWKLELGLAKSQHYTFSDLPALLNVLGAPEQVLEAASGRVGTLNGLRALKIVQTYVVAFLDFVLHHNSSEVLQHPVLEYPEVSIIDQ